MEDKLHFDITDSRLSVHGLGWFNEDKPRIQRLPARLENTFRKEVWELARHASGVRICLRTDSRLLTLRARCDNPWVLYNFTAIGQNGFDLYVDGRYMGSTPETGKDCEIEKEWDLGSGKMKDVVLYLPLYKGVDVKEILLDSAAKVAQTSAFSVKLPVVYYGTSITQGGCASNAGMTYPAILGRRLNIDFVNLGFSGYGLGDEAVARAIAEIKASAVVLDYWGNVDPKEFRATLPRFLEILREKSLSLPVLVTGPYTTVGGDVETFKKIASDFVEERRLAGDKQIFFVDLSPAITSSNLNATVDGVHANSHGFVLLSDALEGPLKSALNLK